MHFPFIEVSGEIRPLQSEILRQAVAQAEHCKVQVGFCGPEANLHSEQPSSVSDKAVHLASGHLSIPIS
jgi:hypothetical protein